MFDMDLEKIKVQLSNSKGFSDEIVAGSVQILCFLCFAQLVYSF
jgi:hypothetical protein